MHELRISLTIIRMNILTVFRQESGWTKAYSDLMLDVLRRTQGGHGKRFVSSTDSVEFALNLTGFFQTDIPSNF